jgi:thiol-disulfide isomerase/thioredoxin/outer membrane lipoprotein-sorting protein
LIVASANIVQAAEEIPRAESTAENRQKGEAILKHVSEFYSKLKSFSFVLASETSVKVDAPNMADLKFDATYDVAVKRPNKIAIVETGGSPLLDQLSDGKVLSIYSSEAKKYLEVDAPATVQKALRDPMFRTAFGSLKGSGLDAILSDTIEPWTSFSAVGNNKEVAFVQEEKLDGVDVDKVQIQGPKFSEYIYVDRGSQPWIRRITETDGNIADIQVPPGQPRMLVLNASAVYKNPVANPNIPESKFKFVPPAGVSKVDSFAPEPPPSPLVGTPAPDFTAELADGKVLTLSKLKNKKVVMLDFWATWCGPCRAALPLVSQVAQDYAKKGVVFYSVNEQEDKTKVLEFLQKTGLSMNVVLDRDAKIGDKYKVDAIPHTFIIDRKGIIRNVHRGYTADINRALSRELNNVLGIKKKK